MRCDTADDDDSQKSNGLSEKTETSLMLKDFVTPLVCVDTQ